MLRRFLVACLVLSACSLERFSGPARSEAPLPSSRPATVSSARSGSPSNADAAVGPSQPAARRPGAAPSASGSAAPAAAPLPPEVAPGRWERIAIPRDRSAYVIHGVAGRRAAYVYLHGVCGNIAAIEPFAGQIAEFGTLVALHGDRRCDIPRRYRWSGFIPGIHDRIQRALQVVKDARGGQLDLERRTVIGYSQGATRAAALVERYPQTYPLLMLAGPPTKPRVGRSGNAEAIAVLGGEWEPNEHMRLGVEELVRAGKVARYFELPRAAHGEYGPEGARVFRMGLEYLQAAAHAGRP